MTYARLAASILMMASLGGCVSEGPPPRPAPRDVPQQPAGLVVERVVPAIDKLADDTDRNGFYDTFRVAIFLFSGAYGQSIEAPGTLECTLVDPLTNTTLAAWRFGPDQLRQAFGMSGVMPGYNLLLNMNQSTVGGTDKVKVNEALFTCTFTQEGHTNPVPALSKLVVMVGRLR